MHTEALQTPQTAVQQVTQESRTEPTESSLEKKAASRKGSSGELTITWEKQQQ